MGKNSPLVTKMCKENHGGITRKATIWNADTAKGEGYIPVKQNDLRLQDVTRYGGLTNVVGAGYTLVEYYLKEKKIRTLEQLPVYLGRVDSLTKEVMLQYFFKSISEEHKGKSISNISIRKKFIPFNALIKLNGFYYYLGGKTGNSIVVRSAVQACFTYYTMNYIKKIEKAVANEFYEEKEQGINVLSKEKNQKLFEQIKNKYQNSIFQNKIGLVGNIIVENEKKFNSLAIPEQCYTLMEIIKNLNTGDGINMILIGGKKETGKTAINKKILSNDDFILVQQSPTGLFQKEIDLLTV